MPILGPDVSVATMQTKLFKGDVPPEGDEDQAEPGFIGNDVEVPNLLEEAEVFRSLGVGIPIEDSLRFFPLLVFY